VSLPNLGRRGSNLPAEGEARLVTLERAVARLSSRALVHTRTCTVQRVAKTAHGWSVGTWAKDLAGTWSTAQSSSTFTADAIGVVVTVVDADTVDIVIDGDVLLFGTSFTAWLQYFLSTSAGTATSTKPTAPNVVQPLFVALEDGWIHVGPSPVVARSVRLSELLDVTLTSPASGDRLKYNGSAWVNAVMPLTDISDVQIAALADQQVLSYDSGTGKWKNRTLTAVTTLAGLSDVTITSVANLDFLRYDTGSSKWKNVNLGLIAYDGASASLSLDGGSGAATPTKVGIAGANSRLILSQTTNPLDFILSGSVSGGTDISARIRRVSSSQVAFFDQGTATTTAGTSVLEWTCSATAASRLFEFKCAMRAPFGSGFGVDGSSLSISTSNAIMVFAGTEIDPDSIYNAGSGVFTAPVAGKYLVTCNASLSCGYLGSPASATVTAGIYKNDTGLSGAAAYAHTQNLTINSALQDNRESITLSRVMTLAATDTLCVAMKYANNQGTAASMQIDNGTFSVIYLGT
jgi:hypothetical protein